MESTYDYDVNRHQLEKTAAIAKVKGLNGVAVGAGRDQFVISRLRRLINREVLHNFDKHWITASTSLATIDLCTRFGMPHILRTVRCAKQDLDFNQRCLGGAQYFGIAQSKIKFAAFLVLLRFRVQDVLMRCFRRSDTSTSVK